MTALLHAARRAREGSACEAVAPAGEAGGKIMQSPRLILVTGASSFVGLHVAAALRRRGHSVFGSYRSKRPSLLAEQGVELVQASWEDPAKIAPLPPAIDVLVHLVASSPSPTTTNEDLVRGGPLAAATAFAYARRAGARKIILASSISIYGRIEVPRVDELTPINEPAPYGAGKLLAERILADMQADLAAVALRLPGVVGPLSHRNWMSRIADELANHRPIRIFNPDALFNNVVHINDLAEFVADLAERDEWKGTHAFPLGASAPLTIEDVATRLRGALDSLSRIEMVSSIARPFTIDSSYASRAFGYRPRPVAEIVDQLARDRRC